MLALGFFLTCTAIAQDKLNAKPNVSAPPFNPAVYRIGERLTYNVNYSQFISAAHVELFVAGRGNFFGREGIQLNAHIETTGVINAALFSTDNDYTTYVLPDSGLPYRAQSVMRQAGRVNESSIDYNQVGGTEAISPKIRAGELSGIYDLISALYRVRAMPLTEGSTYLLTARHEGEEYQAEIKVVGKEMVRTSVGNFKAIATRVNVKKGPDYDLRVFFTDDEWHVPVLIAAKQNGTKIQAELVASTVTPPVDPNQKRTIVKPANALPTPTPASAVIGTLPPDLPFAIGEQLNYQVYLGSGTQPVGSVNIAVKSRGRFFNRDGLQFSFNAQTLGPAAIAVKDQMTSFVDPATLLPFRTEFTFSEGRHRSAHIYNLDQDRGAATSDNSRERIEIPVGTHDLLSALYAIRTFDLSIQKQNAISIMAVNRPRALMVKALRRETLELGGQKIPCLMLSLTTDDPQPDRLQVRIWVGDDARHLPLRITAVTEAGPIRADLAIVPVNPR
ncbi:MAG TPA: DUF3108 domain-containing protein [Verrucomicrobiae bacterium]